LDAVDVLSTTQAMKYTVFLGHTGQDGTASNFAAFLSQECKCEQVSCFYDADSICPGIFYDARIQDAIKTCEVFISILSPTYFKRYWCMHELDLAMQAGRCILPVFYGIEGEKDLPSEKSAFLEHFSSEDRVDHDELNRWWTNVADTLPRIQGIRHSDFAIKDADIKVIQNIMMNVRGLASGNSVVSLLLEKGADINAKDDCYGNAPLHETPLHWASRKGADVNARNGYGATQLHYASREGHEATISLLLEKGANVNAKSNGGDTPLHWASKYGNDAIVSLLLENGAKVNVKGEYGWTPLHYASSKGQDAVVSLLLENGADVDAKIWNGETPLHGACREGLENIISLLLEKGANLTITNNIGETPSQLAQKENKQNCVVAIEQFLQRQAEKKQFQKKCSEKFKTRAALDRELQRLQHLIDAAKDSVDSDVNSAAVTAKAEYEMLVLNYLNICQYPN
jgi:ankyrin repeat protein